ncbi:MAG: hypothetical protein WEB89_03525 [Balneolales bacterium]
MPNITNPMVLTLPHRLFHGPRLHIPLDMFKKHPIHGPLGQPVTHTEATAVQVNSKV